MSDQPSAQAVSSSPAVLSWNDYVQPNLNHGLRIWWALYWPTTLISLFLTMIVNKGLKALYENTDARGDVIGPIMKFDAYFFTFSVALLIMAYILRKEFRHFRIALVSTKDGTGRLLVPPTMSRTFRVWWTYTWRSLLYSVIGWVVVILPMSWFVGLFNPRPLFAQLIFAIVGFIVGGSVSLFAIYSNILDEDIGDFRVCLLPRHSSPAIPVAPAEPVAES
jgi:hypothetical protein